MRTAARVGDQEVENKTVSVRSRKGDNLGAMPMDELLSKLLMEVAAKAKQGLEPAAE